MSRRLICFFFCCLLIATFPANACQDVGKKKVDVLDLVSRIRSKSEQRNNLFIGLSARSKKTLSKEAIVEDQAEYSFSQSKRDVWRIDLSAVVSEGVQQKIVTVRNQDFGFNASQEPSGEYVFWLLGYDPEVQAKIDNNLLGQFPFAVVAGLVNTVPLELFLTTPRLQATSISNLDEHLGRTVEGINFRIPFSGGVISGEFHWLPTEGYLLRRILVNVEAATPEGEVQINRTVDKLINYNIVAGRVIPWSIQSTFSNGRVQVHEISSVGEAVSDAKFYTPESVGLITPKRPVEKWFVWACIAGTCLVGSIVFFVWGGGRTPNQSIANDANAGQ